MNTLPIIDGLQVVKEAETSFQCRCPSCPFKEPVSGKFEVFTCSRNILSGELNKNDGCNLFCQEDDKKTIKVTFGSTVVGEFKSKDDTVKIQVKDNDPVKISVKDSDWGTYTIARPPQAGDTIILFEWEEFSDGENTYCSENHELYGEASEEYEVVGVFLDENVVDIRPVNDPDEEISWWPIEYTMYRKK